MLADQRVGVDRGVRQPGLARQEAELAKGDDRVLELGVGQPVGEAGHRHPGPDGPDQPQ